MTCFYIKHPNLRTGGDDDLDQIIPEVSLSSAMFVSLQKFKKFLPDIGYFMERYQKEQNLGETKPKALNL